jgi:formamidase
MRYTSVIVQPDHYNVWHRKTIEKNLNRYLELIEFACTSSGTSTAGSGKKRYAPVKLISFPEFFLQGFTTAADIQKYKDDILITIPGKETEALGKMARKYGIYICGAALEKLEGWDAVFNCGFIISPEGEVIHKYHKFTPAIQWELTISPHDVYDDYLKKFGKGKSILETFFPVTDTEIGKLGTYICMDGHFPEIARALTMNGAEVMIRPTAFPEPIVYEPKNWWEIQNRARALENAAYVIAPNTGLIRSGEGDEKHAQTFPKHFCPGDSMIVDFEGQIIGRTPYPGESLVFGVIDIEALRERRMESARNFPTLLRNEVFREIYKDRIYPPNKFTEIGWTNFSQLSQRSPEGLGIIDDFIEKGIYTKP